LVKFFPKFLKIKRGAIEMVKILAVTLAVVIVFGLAGIVMTSKEVKYDLYFWNTTYDLILDSEKDASGFAIINKSEEGNIIVKVNIKGLESYRGYELKSNGAARDFAMTNGNGVVEFQYNQINQKFTSVNIWNTNTGINVMGFAYGGHEN
jgi:hypothetical protein